MTPAIDRKKIYLYERFLSRIFVNERMLKKCIRRRPIDWVMCHALHTQAVSNM